MIDIQPAVHLLQPNVAQIGVRNVADEDPPDFEDALPFVRRPNCAAPGIIDLSIQR